MAKKKIASRGKDNGSSKPQYPYTTTPNDLKKLLQLIPNKPKPPKLTMSVVKAWGIGNSNAYTALSVLREIGLIDSAGTPLDGYVAFMSANSGAALALKVRERYSGLFDHHQDPQNASNDDLKRFFNIYSGGSEKAIEYQVRTFKVLAEFCRFDAPISAVVASVANPASLTDSAVPASHQSGSSIHFDLHIHLPEAKSIAEYESIIRAISDYIVQKVRS